MKDTKVKEKRAKINRKEKKAKTANEYTQMLIDFVKDEFKEVL